MQEKGFLGSKKPWSQQRGHCRTADVAARCNQNQLAALVVQQGGVLGADPAVAAGRALELALLVRGEVCLLAAPKARVGRVSRVRVLQGSAKQWVGIPNQATVPTPAVMQMMGNERRSRQAIEVSAPGHQDKTSHEKKPCFAVCTGFLKEKTLWLP